MLVLSLLYFDINIKKLLLQPYIILYIWVLDMSLLQFDINAIMCSKDSATTFTNTL